MPHITHPHAPASSHHRLTIASGGGGQVEAEPAAPGPPQDLPHDPEDAVVQAVARGAGPRELIRTVMHELARDAARVEWLMMHPTAFPADVVVEFGRMAGRRQRVLRGLVTGALRDLDAEQQEAPVPPEVLAQLQQMFVATVLTAARGVCSPEDASRFRERLLERMSG